MKKTSVQKLTFASMLTALGMVALVLSAFIPNMDLSLTAVAGLCPAAAVARDGRRSGLMTWAATSILGLLLGYTRESAVLFVFLFGLYPVVKSLCEKTRSLFWGWTFKIMFANAGFAMVVGMSMLYFPAMLESDFPLPAVWVVFNAAFVVYDFFLTQAILFMKKRMKIDRM